MNPEMLQAVAAMTDLGYIVKIFVSLLLFVFGGYLLYSAMFARRGFGRGQRAGRLAAANAHHAADHPRAVDDVRRHQGPQLATGLLVLDHSVHLADRYDGTHPYDIPLWEVALSLVVLYASFVGMVWFAAKIYRVGIFMYGKKPSLKELFKWIRYKY